MKIVLPGGSGQVGTLLARSFHAKGYEVVVLGRTPVQAPWRTVGWDAETIGTWASEIDGSDVVINLAGRSVNCRYNATNRQLIMNSRVLSTHAVGAAIARASKPPPLWLQASTATIYSHRFDAANDDETGVIGGNEPNLPATWRFSIDVATAWERALYAAHTPNTRKVALRSAIVLSPDRGGIFDTLLTLTRRGLGGQASNGQQYVSWIHDVDFIRAIDWLITHPEFSGPVNIAAPNPLPNADFMRALRKASAMPIGLPATAWMLEVGALVLGTETELLLKSRRVIASRLMQSGFSFQYPEWPAAANDLVNRWRQQE
jgi:uncharacterized protein